METKKIAYKNLPMRSPLIFITVVYLLLDKFRPSKLVIGILIPFGILIVIGWIVELFTKEEIDVLK